MPPRTDYRLDMQKGEHRALVLRAYLDLLSQGEETDAAQLRAPKLAMERWKSGADCPGFYARRWQR
jgi:hypothetical protein